MDLDEVTELEDSSVFRLEYKNFRPDERDLNFLAGMTFEMNYDLKIVQRNTYNIFDLLSDVGGI